MLQLRGFSPAVERHRHTTALHDGDKGDQPFRTVAHGNRDPITRCNAAGVLEVAGKRVDCVEELRKSPRLVQIFDKECVAKLSTRGHHCAEIGLGIAVRLDRVAIARGLNHLERRTGSGQLCDSGVVCGSEFAHGAQKLQLRAVCVRPA